MRRILICTGILGGGTALTFAAAALAATLLPGGTIVPGNNGVMFATGGGVMVKGGVAVPVPAPAIQWATAMPDTPAPSVDLPVPTANDLPVTSPAP
jgi:hypothetical protein